MNERKYSLDSLKFLCIFGVVFVHGTLIGQMEWGLTGKIINTIARVCVPLFFITTGYFFYNKCTKQYSRKYTLNLIKTFITWTGIYILYSVIIITMSNITNFKDLFYNIHNYFYQFHIRDIYYGTGIVKYHLWYLSAMILIIPILHFLISKSLLTKALILSFILNIIGILIPVLTNIPFWRVRDGVFYGLFYCILGAFIKKKESVLLNITEKISNFKYSVAIILLFCVMICERFMYIFLFSNSGNYFFSTIPLSVLIFIFFLKNNNILKNTILNKLGKHTLGIYLIHPLIIDTVVYIESALNISWISSNVLWQLIYIPILITLCYVFYEFFNNIKNRITIHKFIFSRTNLNSKIN
ncbi:acyltransferase [uncultured Clostridium sp.]|uniref:acyltransferase n=1 Tax=uncultured Clostridium sp. TaxID=59620 RepID=UPI0025E94356|nr:acyltransferase family protein [uncultured Clostridium sp.]